MAAFSLAISDWREGRSSSGVWFGDKPEMDDGGRWGEKDVERRRAPQRSKREKKRIMLIPRQQGKYWSNNLKDYCIVMAKLGVGGLVGNDALVVLPVDGCTGYWIMTAIPRGSYNNNHDYVIYSAWEAKSMRFDRCYIQNLWQNYRSEILQASHS